MSEAPIIGTVSGYQIREAVRRWEMVNEAVEKQWATSLFVFETDKVDETPWSLMGKFSESEIAIARLQTAQARFNLHVRVNVLGTEMTLSEAVKRVGGAGRAEKLWKSYAANNGKDRYSSQSQSSRSRDEEFSQRVVPVKDCLAMAQKAAKFAGALRAAIAEGNSSKMKLEDLGIDSSLL